MLSTAHMEHGLPLLSGMDLGALMGAQDPSALLEVLGKAGGDRVIRRLGLVQRATVADLLEMESSPKKAAEMEADAAGRPYAENFADALRFFGELGSSLAALTSSDPAEADSQQDQHQPEGSRSEG